MDSGLLSGKSLQTPPDLDPLVVVVA